MELRKALIFKIYSKMIQSGTFKLFGQKLIDIIIHRDDVATIAPLKRGQGSVIYLKNKVPYTVSESPREVQEKLNWVAA